MPVPLANLVSRFREIGDARIRGLPIFNPRLTVEAVGFSAFEEHRLGILVAPWFLNAVILPGNDTWDDCQIGAAVTVDLPGAEFRVCRDEVLGTYLSAILFTSVSDFPNQDTAREIAVEILAQLRQSTPNDGRTVSRRSLLTGSA